MLLNSKSISDQLKHKYVLVKLARFEICHFPMESNISVLFSKYM